MADISSHNSTNALLTTLTAPGAPFEMQTQSIRGFSRRVFCNAPKSFADIYRMAAPFGPRTMIVSETAQMSYAEVFSKAAAQGAFLKRLSGAQPLQGQRIAIVMSNRTEWIVSFIAITAMGATAVLVNSRGSAPELAQALEDSQAVMILADERRALQLSESACGRHMIVVSEARDKPVLRGSSWIPFSEAIQGWESATLAPVSMHPEDEALIMFTSGTTGPSKATLFDQRAVMTALMHIQLSGALVAEHIVAKRGADVFANAADKQAASLLAFPLFHVSGCYAVFLSGLMRGAKAVLLSKWDAEKALELIEQEQVSAFAGAPAMYWDLLRAERGGRRLQSLLSIGAGGQVFAPSLLKEIASAFPDAVLGIGYGMTECGGTICAIGGEELASRPTAAGQVLPSVDIKIVDERGEQVAPNQEGEILIAGAMLMTEYCGRAKATSEMLQDGWLKSGDIGRLDERGYLHVVDRKKNIVISGGENISCSEVESALAELTDVEDAAVFSVPDERLGEKLVLAVVPRSNVTITEQLLMTYLAQKLAAYKIPQSFIFMEQLPRNASGKVLRHELQARFKLQSTEHG